MKEKEGRKRRKKQASLTCTFGPGDQRRPRRARAPLPGPGQQDLDLVLHVRVQVPQLVGGGVDHVRLGPVAGRGAVLHLLEDDRPVADDAVGIGLDPEVGGADGQQLGRRDGGGRSCGKKVEPGGKCGVLICPPP